VIPYQEVVKYAVAPVLQVAPENNADMMGVAACVRIIVAVDKPVIIGLSLVRQIAFQIALTEDVEIMMDAEEYALVAFVRITRLAMEMVNV